jgi:hypothetical protein
MEDFCVSHNYTQRDLLLLLLLLLPPSLPPSSSSLYTVFQNYEESSWNNFLLETASRDQISRTSASYYHFLALSLIISPPIYFHNTLFISIMVFTYGVFGYVV